MMAYAEEDVLLITDEFEPDPPKKRNVCCKCKRPTTVCWCSFLPNPPIQVSSKILILQHPYEDKRCLSTTLMLQHGLHSGCCNILKGTKFDANKIPLLKEFLHADNTVLLYPGDDAIAIETLQKKKSYNVILLDGTWMQARGLYGKNSFLQKITSIKLPKSLLSKYVVRTQPTDECLSTLESAAMALQILDNRPGLYEVLTRPLKAMCDFQLAHGAVEHQSKAYLIKNGLYKGKACAADFLVDLIDINLRN